MTENIGNLHGLNTRNPLARLVLAEIPGGKEHRRQQHTLAGSAVGPELPGQPGVHAGIGGDFSYLGKVETENRAEGRAALAEHVGNHAVAHREKAAFHRLHRSVVLFFFFFCHNERLLETAKLRLPHKKNLFPGMIILPKQFFFVILD